MNNNFTIENEISGYERFIKYIISQCNNEITRQALQKSWKCFVDDQRKRTDVVPLWGLVEKSICFKENNELFIGLY